MKANLMYPSGMTFLFPLWVEKDIFWSWKLGQLCLQHGAADSTTKDSYSDFIFPTQVYLQRFSTHSVNIFTLYHVRLTRPILSPCRGASQETPTSVTEISNLRERHALRPSTSEDSIAADYTLSSRLLNSVIRQLEVTFIVTHFDWSPR